MSISGKPKLPKCQDCGAPDPHSSDVARRDSRGAIYMAQEWVCGSCEYRRLHPDAKPAIAPPREQRPKRMQAETLLDALA